MEGPNTNTAVVSTEEIAHVLQSMAELFARLRSSDLALQESLSALAARARTTPEMSDLQHLDLLTQTHEDLTRLLPTLAAILHGERIDQDTLKKTLSLRSLQDALFDRSGHDEPEATPGELSLF